MRILALWEQELQGMRNAPVEPKPVPDQNAVLAITRLVAFVDGCIELDEDAAKHPLGFEIRNYAPWNMRRLRRISDDLLAVAPCTGFERIRKALGKPAVYEDATEEVRLAAQFVRAELEVSFVTPSGKQPTPDLSVNAGGKETCVEFTRIRASAETRESFGFIDPDNWRTPELDGLAVSITFHRYVSEPRRAEIRLSLSEAARKARESGSMQTLELPGVMQAVLTPKKPQEGGLIMNIGFAGNPSDEVDRLSKRIHEKAAQLREDRPGVLFIVDSELRPGDLDAPDYATLVGAFDERVFDEARAGAVVVSHRYMATSAKDFAGRDAHWAAWRRIEGTEVEDRLLVRNPYARLPVPVQVLAALGSPFETQPQE